MGRGKENKSLGHLDHGIDSSLCQVVALDFGDLGPRMPIGRKLEQPVDPKAGNWAILELIDASVLEGAESRLRLPATAGEPMIWQFGPDQYPVEWDTAAFAGLQSGCAGLS